MMDNNRDEIEKLKSAAHLEAVKMMVYGDKDAAGRLRTIVRQCSRLLRENPGLAEHDDTIDGQKLME